MKKDRFLLAILLSISVLVVLALAVFFIRSRGQNYVSDDTPQGVVHNYLFALHQGDYQRAYVLLFQGEEVPEFDNFENGILAQKRELDNLSVQIGAVDQMVDKALVELIILHPTSGFFSNGWREETSATLVLDDAGAWRITRMPYPFWGSSWNLKLVPNP